MEKKIFLMSAPWCNKCQQVKPMLHSKVKGVEEINIDEDPSIPAELGIMSIPSVVNNTGEEPIVYTGQARSEERRVGKECRSRWSPYH